MATIDLLSSLSIRKFDLSDLDDFWLWASDERLSACSTWKTFTNKDDLRRYVEEIVLPSPWYRAIVVGSQPVGAIAVKIPVEQKHRGEVGYVLATEWWGKGVVTAALRMATELAMAEIEGLERLEALVFEENKASQRVLEKVGFQREGVLRSYILFKGVMKDTLIYSFVRGDNFLI